MRKLYFQIYLGVVASLVLLVVLAATFWHFQGKNSPQNQILQTVRDVIVMALPPADAPPELQRQCWRSWRAPPCRVCLCIPPTIVCWRIPVAACCRRSLACKRTNGCTDPTINQPG